MRVLRRNVLTGPCGGLGGICTFNNCNVESRTGPVLGALDALGTGHDVNLSLLLRHNHCEYKQATVLRLDRLTFDRGRPSV
jgi:hypothetical protein